MSGYRSSYFRHNCAVDGCFQESGQSWDDIITAFPRGIRPTDIDGMVEVNGHFLFLEEKRTRVPMPDGQRWALQRLARHHDITCVVFRAAADDYGDVEVLVYDGGDHPEWERMTRAAFVDRIRRWANQWEGVET